MNHNLSTDFFKEISFECVDSWPKIFLFRTHYLWNSTTELTLMYIPVGIVLFWTELVKLLSSPAVNGLSLLIFSIFISFKLCISLWGVVWIVSANSMEVKTTAEPSSSFELLKYVTSSVFLESRIIYYRLTRISILGKKHTNFVYPILILHNQSHQSM